MGFYIRKSINVGPFRLNLSKSGIGVSVGVKGARISTGPRGAHVHVGRHGFYYRQRIDSFRSEETATSPSYESSAFETADFGQIVEGSSDEILSQINKLAHQSGLAPVIAIAVCLSALLAGSSGGIIAAATVVVVGLASTWVASKIDKRRLTTLLSYELTEDAAERFHSIQRACEKLASSERVWRTAEERPNWDWKRTAGATSLITRHRVKVGRLKPPFITTNVDTWGIDAGTLKLFFLPDLVFVWQRRSYGTVSYDSLNVTFAPTRFIEHQGVPRDARIIDHTWQYVRKDGGPDLRFANNRQIPVVQYGLLEIMSATGLSIRLHVSNTSLALEFAATFGDMWYRSFREQPRRRSTTEERREARHPVKDVGSKSAFDILGVEVGASWDDIRAAYHRMARMYHPDKVAGLAPEFRELAERRMKEINAAYEELERQEELQRHGN